MAYLNCPQRRRLARALQAPSVIHRNRVHYPQDGDIVSGMKRDQPKIAEPKTASEFDNAVEFIVRWADGQESVQPPLPFDCAA